MIKIYDIDKLKVGATKRFYTENYNSIKVAVCQKGKRDNKKFSTCKGVRGGKDYVDVTRVE